MARPDASGPRARLNRPSVLAAAVALADEVGVEGLSMRRLAQELGVVPMALYKHVRNKDELLDGMVEFLIGEIGDVGETEAAEDWKGRARTRVLAAREVLMRHPWARRLFETRSTKTGAVLDYMNSFAGILLSGGLSAELTHHAMHAIGGRMWGFTQELFEDEPSTPPQGPEAAAMMQEMAQRFPHIAAIASMEHDDSVVGRGCDDQFEFEFALDLILDGIERRHLSGWRSTP
ncbi:TetR/AcrR family transcriptional regulator C-terminal domain-containing protein [Salinibacterium sp. SYSU T00001]|uniref:TetR/AcrR family transcriptional regulator C-terminal domain-containing protein n=1 Tax=Homoserinimonas sedimenticola TaxID=2986805 RepID=UPI00223591F1|nr:TetR/AcrR family transcriptional regulator C-terminal domain-containing protein [Salinibacterium sedimenticola]MCW4386091.1 TetR/AcrR family transcriptional regulator C-terminal domain-containing protein [Salinibacterium sedimenticola]